jgi:Tfp pilus assembly protein FimT
MLVVVAVIVAIFLIAVPSINSVVQSNRMTASGEQLLGLIASAQQMAVADGRPVEIRMLSYTVVGGSQTPSYQTVLLLHHYSLGEVGPDSQQVANAEGISVLAAEPMILPGGIVISGSKNLSVSSITTNDQFVTKADSQNASGPNAPGRLKFFSNGRLLDYKLDYLQNLTSYCSVIIYPDGTSLPPPPDTSKAWFISLVDEKDEANTHLDFGTLHNFYCIQIDPFNGHATSYRP